ncbi:Uncharacterised protein [Mycobacteroides abscessus subsp. abscessus]|nr:Uncharacterised protein [Mycobacteroides abscessus subsp. abscessus]
MSESWFLQLFSDPVGFATKKITGGKIDFGERERGMREKISMKHKEGPLTYNSRTNGLVRKVGKSYSGGLERVPYDRFPATLHKGEQVLTAEEAKAYRNGGGQTITYQFGDINIQGNIEDHRTVDRLMGAIFKELRDAAEAGA